MDLDEPNISTLLCVLLFLHLTAVVVKSRAEVDDWPIGGVLTGNNQPEDDAISGPVRQVNN